MTDQAWAEPAEAAGAPVAAAGSAVAWVAAGALPAGTVLPPHRAGRAAVPAAEAAAEVARVLVTEPGRDLRGAGPEPAVGHRGSVLDAQHAPPAQLRALDHDRHDLLADLLVAQ